MSSVQTQITDLPTAQPLTGSESVPIVQNGVTVKTTTGAMAGAGALNYPFLTVGSTSGLSQARYLTVSSGLSLVDNGAGSTLQINMTGAAASLNLSSNGIQVKTGSNTLTGRSIGVTSGLSISNADGVSGDPTISLGTFLSNFVSLTGTGVLAIQSGSVGKINILGTSSQTTILNGDGSGNITVSLADNAVMPGAGSITLPNGTTAQRVTNLGSVRYNTSLQQFEGYSSTGWNQFSLTGGVTSFSAGTTGFTPNTDATGAVTLGGILNAASGGTGASTLTGYVYGNGTGVMTASTTIPNAGLANSSITINGNSVSLGGSITVTASTTSTLTIGTGLSGTSFNGSTPVTIAIDSTVATLTNTQTLTNKTISGASNTLSNIGNSSLTNSSVTYNGVNVALGSTGTITAVNPNALTIGTGLSGTSYTGAAAVTIAIDSTVATLTGVQTLTNKTMSGASNTFSAIPNSALTNSTISGVALGGSLFNLTAGTGVSFSSGTTYNGSAAITITATGSGGTVTSVTGTSPVVSSGGTTPAISMPAATTSVSGYLTSTDWNTFNNKGSGTVTSVSGTSGRITSTGGTAPVIDLASGVITAGTTGSITAIPVITVDTYGRVTSITTAANPQGTVTSVTGTSPVVSSGGATPAISLATAYGDTLNPYASKTANTILAAPNGSAGVPTFRALTTADIPTLAYGSVTSVSFTGGLISVATPTTTPALTVAGTNGGIVYFSSASTWASSAALAANALVIGGGAGVAPSTTTTGTGVITALGTNVGTAGAFVVNGGALGTPSSGTVTNLTGTASININGTVGGTTPTTGAFTTISASGVITSTVATGTAPFTVASTTAVANLTATNAVNTGITAASSGATNYLTFVTATTGNLPQLVNSSITANAANGTLTGGIAGGAF